METKKTDDQNNYYQYLQQNYKGTFVPHHKNSDQIIQFLSKKFLIREIEKDDIPTLYLKIQIENFVNSRTGERFNLRADTLELHVIEIERNAESERYFKDFVPMCRDDGSSGSDERLVVLIEKNSNQIVSNSWLLTLELFIEIGIEPDDYENENDEYFWYLSMLDRYRKIEEPGL